MLYVCPDNRRSAFWPERNRLAALVQKRIHLLFNNIGCFAYASGKKPGPFYKRNPYLRKTIGFKNLPRLFFNMLPDISFRRKYVVKTSDGVDHLKSSELL